MKYKLDNMQTENAIRDELATNLQIIESGLTFLEKEYKLPNYVGSKGFVDILATDVYGNYVIIEIKRSKATSRETLQEIIKYVGLIKQNYKARDSEIRVIIVSTNWEELFVPFSEFAYQSTLHVKGFLILLNSFGNLGDIKEIFPEPVESQRRKFARTYEIALFYSEEKRDQYVNSLADKSTAIGIVDFVIASLSVDKTHIVFPYATCFCFNELSVDHFLQLKAIKGQLDMEEDEFENKREFSAYLEQCVLTALYEKDNYDSMELGSPEKLQSVLQVQSWNLNQLFRFGIFKSDPRLTDDMLIRELQGYNGGNENLYSNFADSVQKDRIKEIFENAPVPFEWNEKWHVQIKSTLRVITNQNKPFRIVIHVYSPQSIFYGIYRFLKFQDMDYLPMYKIFVDFYKDETINVYEGALKWNGKNIDLKSYKKFINDEKDTIISKPADVCGGYFDGEILRHFNLALKSKVTVLKKSHKTQRNYFVIDSNGNLQVESKPSHSLIRWVKQHLQFCWDTIRFYDANTFHI